MGDGAADEHDEGGEDGDGKIRSDDMDRGAAMRMHDM